MVTDRFEIYGVVAATSYDQQIKIFRYLFNGQLIIPGIGQTQIQLFYVNKLNAEVTYGITCGLTGRVDANSQAFQALVGVK